MPSLYTKYILSSFSQNSRFTTVVVIIRGDGLPKVGNCNLLYLGLISFLHLNCTGIRKNCLFHGHFIEHLVGAWSDIHKEAIHCIVS
jgi:hypothetical protein